MRFWQWGSCRPGFCKKGPVPDAADSSQFQSALQQTCHRTQLSPSMKLVAPLVKGQKYQRGRGGGNKNRVGNNTGNSKGRGGGKEVLRGRPDIHTAACADGGEVVF